MLDVSDGLFGVTVAAEKPLAANDEFHTAGFDGLGSDIEIASTYSRHDLVERDAMKTKFVWVDFNLILANVTSDGSDFADTLDGLQVVLDNEILQTP